MRSLQNQSARSSAGRVYLKGCLVRRDHSRIADERLRPKIVTKDSKIPTEGAHCLLWTFGLMLEAEHILRFRKFQFLMFLCLVYHIGLHLW